MQLLSLVQITAVHEALNQVRWVIEIGVALVGRRLGIVVKLLALVIIIVFQLLVTFVSCMLLAMSTAVFTRPVLLWKHR